MPKNIGTLIKSLRNIMRTDTGVDGDAQRIGQLAWLIFLKVFDVMEMEWELSEDNYKPVIPEGYRWRDWASDEEGITGDKLLKFVNDELYPTLKTLEVHEDVDPKVFIVREFFSESYNYMKSGILLRRVINKLNSDVDFTINQDRHLFNDIYENLLKELQSAGDSGEYYTPRPVTQFMTDMVNPQLGEKVLDFASGTGGFLVCTLENLKTQIKNIDDQKTLHNSVSGVEKKQLPYMLAVTNLMLHGESIPKIKHGNLLNEKDIRDYKESEKVDIILTNPPFGGAEEDSVTRNFPAQFKTKETADMFMVLLMYMLKSNGRCAIVLPDGFLFGDGIKNTIKEKLLTEFNLHTIVRLPHGVFAPYTDIKTNLLFFDKGQKTKKIWYFEHPLPPNYKKYSKTKPIKIEEFEIEKKWWYNRELNQYAWCVNIEDIKSDNYNLDLKNPSIVEEEIKDPKQLLIQYQESNTELKEIKGEIKAILEQILEEDNLLLEHFDEFLTTSESIKLLKNSIIDFAIKGKLVPQDESEESATMLFKRVAKEKNRIINNCNLKEKFDPKPLSGEDLPFDLPKGWACAKLTQLSENIHYGYTASADEIKKDVRLLRITDIQNNKVNWDTVPGCNVNMDKIDNFVLNKDDILIARTGGTIGKSFLVKDLPVKSIFASYLIRIIPIKQLNPDYIKLFLESPFYWNQLLAKSKGTGQPNVNATSLKSLIVPLPPLSEQKRIMDRLEYIFDVFGRLEFVSVQTGKYNENLLISILKHS